MLYARRFSGTGNPRLRKSNSIWREKQMMNTVRKSENLLPFPVISAAANGDTTAMCAILKHYEGYIAKLCTRTLKDDAGNTYSYVDEEMRYSLQLCLITRSLAFHLGYSFSSCGERVPFPRFPLWAICRSANAYPLLMCFCRSTKPIVL